MLRYAPAPVDNPLKGLVPYQGDVRDYFPHSLEFNYVPYSALVRGYDDFDWMPLEKMLDDIASRGHQAIFRVYLEYPGRTGVIPEFLIKDGVKVTRWLFTESKDKPSQFIETPDYENRDLRRSLKNFIEALGKKYDGDPRIGFITAGLLGTWGEWHNWPRDELFASKEVQAEVMDAYESAFQITRVLVRYPAGERDVDRAANASRKLGYHDDSFAWATLHTGKQGDEWFFLTQMQTAGPEAVAKWKTQPIGGEIRPEAWGRVFDDKPADKKIQDFRQCVEATHVSWLMDSGMFRRKQPTQRIQHAIEQVRRMGYEFHALAAVIGRVGNGRLRVALEFENRGVAPFYYDWKSQWGLFVEDRLMKSWTGTGKVSGLLPGDKPRVWTEDLDVSDVKAGRYTLAVRVPNPLKQGKSIRFANETQDAAVAGWLSLGEVLIP